jgi:hypothetical protein
LTGLVFAIVTHCPTFGGYAAATAAKPSRSLGVVPLQVLDFTTTPDPLNPGATTLIKLTRGAEVSGRTHACAVAGTQTWDTMNAVNKLSLSWTLSAGATAMNDAQFLTAAPALTSPLTLPSAQPGLVGYWGRQRGGSPLSERAPLASAKCEKAFERSRGQRAAKTRPSLRPAEPCRYL